MIAAIPASGIATLVIVAILVVVVAAFLIAIALVLRRISTTLGQVIGALGEVAARTRPVGEVLGSIEADLGRGRRLLEGLLSDGHASPPQPPSLRWPLPATPATRQAPEPPLAPEPPAPPLPLPPHAPEDAPAPAVVRVFPDRIVYRRTRDA
jgi:hypothetical protein